MGKDQEIRGSSPNAKQIFRDAYLHKDDLMGSGYGGTEQKWEYCRKVIAEPINQNGSFLDLGCANGRLLFDVKKWAKEKGFELDVYGVDFVSELVDEARKRFPGQEDHFEVADVNEYTSNRQFTYIRTELACFAEDQEESNIKRYYNSLDEGGKLLIARYWSELSDAQFQELVGKVRDFGLGEPELYRNKCSALAVITKPSS